MINNPTLQFPSTSAAAKAAAFSFITSAFLANAQAPVTERSANPSGSNKPPVTATTNAGTVTQGQVVISQTTPQKSFVSIGDRPAVLFDAPSNRANKTFIILRNTPLEMLVKLEKMTKVRDADGAIGWVENESLGTKRYVQISVTSADIRAAANVAGSSVFDAQRGVLLEVTGLASPDGWLPVKHLDGQTGFVRLTHVWGD